jgi:hypothetical protein
MIQGNINKKYRYVFTMVEKRPQFLVMDKCNLCPFLINDFENGNAKCGNFINPKSTWEDNNYITKVYGYIQKKRGSTDMRILTPISIPLWCNLPTHLTEISASDTINYIKDGKLHVDSGQNYACTVQIVDSEFVEVDDEDGESLIHKKEKTTYIHYNKNGVKTNNKYNQKNTNVCSSCGEHKEEVDRYNHLGMCDICWNKNKFSHPKRYTAKINNFRLKRKEDWKKDKFKVVDLNKVK